MSNHNLKLAITGTGYIAKIHAQAGLNCGAELAAVVNHREESRRDFAEKFGFARTYPTLADLLADGGVDAVIIATPNALHAPQAVAALRAGVHVMVEKPMALNAAEAQVMLDAAQISGAHMMVAHCWRFDEDVVWLKSQVGRLGKVVRTRSLGVHAHWGPTGWFTSRALAGGGALADMGIHALDITRFLLGDPLPTSVYARIGTYYHPSEVDDTGLILVNWDNGTTSLIESGWYQPHADGPEAFTQVYGQEGYGQIFPTHVVVPNSTRDGLETIEAGTTFPRPDHAPQALYDRQMTYFLECVRAGIPPIPGGLEGMINMRVIDAAYESARSGQVVGLP
jgi:predicted dehydrogenase